MNPYNFINQFRQMASNPAQFAMQNLGVSQDIANDPDAIIQKMMQEGKLTQAQYNQARQTASQLKPMFRQMLGGRQ